MLRKKCLILGYTPHIQRHMHMLCIYINSCVYSEGTYINNIHVYMNFLALAQTYGQYWKNLFSDSSDNNLILITSQGFHLQIPSPWMLGLQHRTFGEHTVQSIMIGAQHQIPALQRPSYNRVKQMGPEP